MPPPPPITAEEDDDLNDEFLMAKNHRGDNSRLCWDLSQLQKHLDDLRIVTNQGGCCVICKFVAHIKCTICSQWLYCIPERGQYVGEQCIFDYHLDSFFGQQKIISELWKKRRVTWNTHNPLRAKNHRGDNSRLCWDLSQLQKHLDALRIVTNQGGCCAICKFVAHIRCTICSQWLYCIP